MLGKGSGSVKVLKSNARAVSFGTAEILDLGNKAGNLSNLSEVSHELVILGKQVASDGIFERNSRTDFRGND
jgi:hypothetical protein